MAKKFFKKYSPSPEKLERIPGLGFVGNWFKRHPYLLMFNRRSVSKGAFWGIFSAMIPLLMQPLYCVIFCVVFRANLLVAMLFVLITNPLTSVPIFFFCYKLGAWMLGMPVVSLSESLGSSWSEWLSWVFTNYKPLFLGSMTVGFIASGVAYLVVNYLWRRNVRLEWYLRRRRRERRALKANKGELD
ncbi:MAG: DUF2062 domain-containing protein [Pseudomonadota bacterium]|nr:DUF2062 domain-containing protein [Pseudomonadota bacterium]